MISVLSQTKLRAAHISTVPFVHGTIPLLRARSENVLPLPNSY